VLEHHPALIENIEEPLKPLVFGSFYKGLQKPDHWGGLGCMVLFVAISPNIIPGHIKYIAIK